MGALTLRRVAPVFFVFALLASSTPVLGALDAIPPDARIRIGSGAYVGKDVFNETGHGQSRHGARANRTTFDIRFKNTMCCGSPRFTVKAVRSGSGYRVRYYQGDTEVTAAVVAGTYKTRKLEYGQEAALHVVVRLKPGAATDAKVSAKVTVTRIITKDLQARDTVKLSVG
jgi:hypothetical protein